MAAVFRLTPLLVLITAIALSGCSNATRWDDADSSAATQSSQKRSKRGNPAFYEVFGERYYVMNSSAGYEERGVASWYGKKFHGRSTSNGEKYNMYAMTAAHKTLPLPTRVKVTNLKNGRTIVVRVNDRGPFVDNRIIDLSYAAAQKLDMITDGTAMVKVVALDDGRLASQTNPAAGISTATAGGPAENMYLQVGAFGDRANAEQLVTRLKQQGYSAAAIQTDTTPTATLYRVRIGPIANVQQFDELVRQMAALQIKDTHLVTESAPAAGG
ncbi:MAG: septal ring lytic transglycosylase RlpA family protein [Gammaproteobacteria bacterium]|nr:septal ring lytic transglycosylase RlpA family protein [Gammaproteobacteria bacterium]